MSTGHADAEPTNSVLGVGVGALVREIGMAMIPVHLKHSYESIMQIVGEKTQQYLALSYNYKCYRNSNEAATV